MAAQPEADPFRRIAQNRQIVPVQVKSGPGGVANRIDGHYVVKVGVGVDDLFDGQPHLLDLLEDSPGVVAGIDNHRLAGHVTAENVTIFFQ